MTFLVQVAPPSNDTPSNSPLGMSGSVAMATMLFGLVGLTAMASSASFPGFLLISMFAGMDRTAAAVGAASNSAKASAARDEGIKLRSIGARMTSPSSIHPTKGVILGQPFTRAESTGECRARPGKPRSVVAHPADDPPI
jgi:hypothetical protein